MSWCSEGGLARYWVIKSPSSPARPFNMGLGSGSGP